MLREIGEAVVVILGEVLRELAFNFAVVALLVLALVVVAAFVVRFILARAGIRLNMNVSTRWNSRPVRSSGARSRFYNPLTWAICGSLLAVAGFLALHNRAIVVPLLLAAVAVVVFWRRNPYAIT